VKETLDNEVNNDCLKFAMIVLTIFQQTLYFANVTMGTPAQSLRLHIDTGSSDLWVNTPSSNLCKQNGSPCANAGTYSANSSSTYSYLSSDFNITYVDGSGATGDYATDTLVIGGATLTGQQFGIGYTSSAQEGILGVGYQLNEVQAGRLGKKVYDNVPAKLVSDKLINSNAYSLWLNDLDANTGSILFGGVDTDQFEGSLATLPIQAESGQYAEFLIALTAVSFAGTSIATNQNIAVLLDSGTSLTYLPDAITQSIYDSVGAQYDSQAGTAYVPCSIASNTSTLDYTFTSPTIKVTMAELVIDVTDAAGQPVYFNNGQQACVFGIAPAGSSTSVLGDTFLRSAYVVYDLSNNQISLAQTKFNVTTNNVLEIGTGSSAVPSATAVQGAASAAGGSSGGSVAGQTAAASSTAKAAAPMKTAAPLGAVVAVGAAMFLAAL
jgi:hypothetical protein